MSLLSPRLDPVRTRLVALFSRKQVWIGLLAGIVVLLGIFYARFVFLAGVNHDEVEHAHVAFKILDGQIPYRDFYQNHWPAYWLLDMQFVRSFPFSVHAIQAGRAASMLALIGSWLLGFRLLSRWRAGKTRLACLVYTWAVILVAYKVDFHEARPDPIMALFVTAGLCLIPARGRVTNGRALLLGTLFGISASISTKMAPMALVAPALILVHCLRDRRLQPGIALLFYGLGMFLGLLPTALWIFHQGLFEAFYFDVFELNLAVSKPWHESFKFLHIPIYLAAVLGSWVWLCVYRRRANRNENGPLVLALALAGGLALSFIARHPYLYNLQVLTIPLAIGFACLVTLLWLRIRGLGFRLLLVGALLGFPTTHIAAPLAQLVTNRTIPQHELQEIMDLARPGERTCTAFAPSHPVFCRDVSTLANGWDAGFPKKIRDPRQLARFQAIWRDGIQRTLELSPDIILRNDPWNVWNSSVAAGLITAEELRALDELRPGYEVKHIGKREVWVRRHD